MGEVKMNFSGLAGDDEHTAVEGPYARLMKTRKWLVVSSGLAALVVLRVYDPVATKALIRITAIPDWLFANAVLGGLIYLIVQYGLLIYQLWVTYDLTLSERLKFRRADDLSKAVEASRAAEKDLAEANSGLVLDGPTPAMVRRAEKRVAMAENQLQAAQMKVSDEKLPGTISWTLADNEAEQALKDLEDARTAKEAIDEAAAALKTKLQSKAARIASAKSNYDLATRDLESLSRQDPSSRGRYILAERAIDTLRLGPPAVASVVAAANLVIAFHSWTYRWLMP